MTLGLFDFCVILFELITLLFAAMNNSELNGSS